MRLQTIFNRVEKFKSFTYGEARFEERADGPALVVAVRPRKNSRPYCSGCLRRGRAYDRLDERRFEFVPLRGILVFLAYRMRRVDRPRCGVTVEMVPWCDGKNQLTTTYRWFLASWARRLSWGEVGAIFRTSWESVRRAVEHAVEWGLAHRDLGGVTAVGVDEVAWQRGHTYMTLVYDISAGTKRLLAVAEHRTEASPRACLDGLGPDFCARVRFVCSDMWRPYLKVIGERLGGAIHVLDRFHIMKPFGLALDEIRAEESRRLKRDGYEPVLKKSRWCLLKRPENLTEKQTVKLSELLKYNLRTVQAYLLREDFQRLWEYSRPSWAGRFLDEWTAPGDAIAPGADEAGGSDDPVASAADPELVPGEGRDVVGSGGGAEQQGEVGDEKVVRLPGRPGGETGPPAQPRAASGAKTHPQILLRSQNFIEYLLDQAKKDT